LTGITANRYASASSYSDRFEVGATASPAVYDVVVPPAPPPEVPQLEAAPLHTHFSAAGRLVPDDGCSWMTDIANDFRVICR
jgi:hypothetical protein